MQELYINNIKVDLSGSTTIPINFMAVDTDTPTAEHNAYSKSVVLDGTPTNNRVFSDAWKLDKNIIGSMYDARKRVPFVLYDNGDILLSGYVKLDKVSVRDTKISYSVTLFSSLGDFFYNLAYDSDGNERTLANLRYFFKDASGNTMSLKDENENPLFNWNSDFIVNGWQSMEWDGNKGTYPIDVIKGAPTYRGHYDDFDNDTVMVKYSELNTTDKGYIENAFIRVPDQAVLTRRYGAYNNWVIAKATRDLDEWEVRDLRSEYMRPTVPLKFVLSAIGDKENNGGYEVIFDDDIKESPLYDKGWLIMDAIDFEDEASYNSLLDAHIDESETPIDCLWVENFQFVGKYSGETNVLQSGGGFGWNTTTMTDPTMEISIVGTHFFPYAVREVNFDTMYSVGSEPCYKDNKKVWSTIFNGWHLRMDIYSGESFTSSLEYCTSTPDYLVCTDPRPSDNINIDYNEYLGLIANKIGVDSLVMVGTNMVRGEDNQYGQIGFKWDTPCVLKASLPKDAYVECRLVYHFVQYDKKVENGTLKEYQIMDKQLFGDGYKTGIQGDLRNYNGEDEKYVNGLYDGTVNPNIQAQTVTKRMLFHQDTTPLDVLLSFTKLIGARYIVDDVEKKVNIIPRSKYYLDGANEIVIDEREKEITPVLTEYKWYEYGLENVDTYANKLYKKKNGLEYGHLKVDTSFEFNNETENVFDGVGLTNLIPYKLNSIYFNELPSSSTTIMQSPTVEVKAFYVSGATLLDNGGINVYARAHFSKPYKVFDELPKLCGFGDDNDNEDIGLTLAVYDGMADYKISVSDNCEMMYYLNDDNPCFIWTNSGSGDTDNDGSEELANHIVNQWPKFSKYLSGENGAYTFSMDFMKPSKTFILDNGLYGDGINLYDLYHKEWINSIYHRNGNKVTLKVKLLDKPMVAARKVYHFANSLWIISEITDWTPQNEFTKVTFCKILGEANLHQWG